MNDGELRDLLKRYRQLKEMPKGEEKRRGELFNPFLRDLLRAWGLEAHSDQRGIRNRDETDVGFSIGRAYYIVEAKWVGKPINADPVGKLALRLKVRPPGTAAVLVSMSGFTKPVRELTDYHPEIILLDDTHIEAMLTGLVDPDLLLHRLFSWTSRRGGSYVALDHLLLSSELPQLPNWADPGGKPGVSYIAEGVRAKALLVTDESPALTFTGMTATADGAMLVTCDQGVMRLDPDTGKTNWELPLSGCSGSPLPGPDAGFFTACESAVVRWDSKGLLAVAGAFRRHSQLLEGPDGERWMFSTTGPTGRVWNGSHTLTRLGSRAGEEKPHSIEFNGQIKQLAITGRNTLYIASSSFAGELDITEEMRLDLPPDSDQAFQAAPLSDVTALHRIGERIILSLGRADNGVALFSTDLDTRVHTRLLQVSAAAATALTVRDGVCFLLLHAWDSDWRPHTALTRPVLLRIALPGSTA